MWHVEAAERAARLGGRLLHYHLDAVSYLDAAVAPGDGGSCLTRRGGGEDDAEPPEFF